VLEQLIGYALGALGHVAAKSFQQQPYTISDRALGAFGQLFGFGGGDKRKSFA
jgi:hypothetical protein